MAESVQADPKSNVTKATFLQFYDEFASSMGEMDRVKSAHATICKRAKSAGINVDELKVSYKLCRQDRAKREANLADRIKYMQWLEKPLGYQGAFDVQIDTPTQDDIEAAEKHAVAEAYQDGYAAGKAGSGTAFCPFDAGSELYQQYMLGVSVGKEVHDKAAALKKPKAAKSGGTGRGRGRPRKGAAPAPQDAGLQDGAVGDSSVRSVDFSTATAPVGSA